jgi:hypothetical protein
MAAKIIAQLVIQGFSILTRATFTAYQQALKSKYCATASLTHSTAPPLRHDITCDVMWCGV